MSNNTKITFKRTSVNSKDISQAPYGLNNDGETLTFGEPLLISTDHNPNNGESYLVIGPTSTNGSNATAETNVQDSIFFRGFSKDKAEHVATYDDDYILETAAGGNSVETQLKAGRVNAIPVTEIDDSNDNKYFILCRNSLNDTVTEFDFDDSGIYIDGKGVMHGAAWNDYAEARNYSGNETVDELVGKVVCENGKGQVALSTTKLQPCSYVVSDTYGTTIGKGDINVAVMGKVLVYTNDEVELGDCLTAGENGKAVKMSRQEISNYPDRILGIVIEIPDYEQYNDINVNGRVWIKVK